MAMGPVVAALAQEDMEAARIVMRRLLWSLNDESGGIGWGAPEAMAHIMAAHAGLADEYIHMLLSYMREDGEEQWQDGEGLEHEALQRDLLRGIGFLARTMPHELLRRRVLDDLIPYLQSQDAEVRALAAQAIGLLGDSEPDKALSALEPLCNDSAPVTLDNDPKNRNKTVGAVVHAAMTRVQTRQSTGQGNAA